MHNLFYDMMFKAKSIHYVAPCSKGNYFQSSSKYYKELQVQNTDKILQQNVQILRLKHTTRG